MERFGSPDVALEEHAVVYGFCMLAIMTALGAGFRSNARYGSRFLRKTLLRSASPIIRVVTFRESRHVNRRRGGGDLSSAFLGYAHHCSAASISFIVMVCPILSAALVLRAC